MENQVLNAFKSNKLLNDIDASSMVFDEIKGKLITLSEGEILYRDGHDADELFLVISGEINIVKKKTHGGPSSLLYVEKDYFGDEELAQSSKRISTAVALKDSYLMSLSKKELFILGRQNPQFAEHLNLNIPADEIEKPIQSEPSMNAHEELPVEDSTSETKEFKNEDTDFYSSFTEDETLIDSEKSESQTETESLSNENILEDDSGDLNILNLTKDDEENIPAEDEQKDNSMFISPEGEKKLTQELKILDEVESVPNEPPEKDEEKRAANTTVSFDEFELPEGWDEKMEGGGFKDEDDITEEDLLRALGNTVVDEELPASDDTEIPANDIQEQSTEEYLPGGEDEIVFNVPELPDEEISSEKIDDIPSPSEADHSGEGTSFADKLSEEIESEPEAEQQPQSTEAQILSDSDEQEPEHIDTPLEQPVQEEPEKSEIETHQPSYEQNNGPIEGMSSDYLQRIIQAAQLVNSNIKIDEVLADIVDVATELVKADRGTLYLIDKESNELWSKIAIGNDIKEIRLKIGEGIAGWVAQSGEVINISNAKEDNRFKGDFDRDSGYQTKSMLGFPIKNRESEVIGVLQLLNSRSGEFSELDQELINAISVHAALAIENAELVERLLQSERVTSLGKMANFLIQDIKKPLLVTKRYAEHLHSKELPTDLKQLVDMMLEQINQVADIVQTTSSYSQGKAILRTVNTGLNELITDYSNRLEPYVRTRNSRLVNELDKNVSVKVDIKEFFQCYSHIVKNACDAMPEGGNILIKTKKSDSKVNITIQDSGLGIPDTLKDKIFEPFMSHGKKEGTGLGLSITKKLVEEMDGSISFTTMLGEGTTFIISLPLATAI